MYATFGDDRLMGMGVARGRIAHFPIDLCRRPYHTLALPCECLIYRLRMNPKQLTICHFDAVPNSRNSSEDEKGIICVEKLGVSQAILSAFVLPFMP